MEQHSGRILTGNILEKGSYCILVFANVLTLVMPFEHQSLKKSGSFSILIKELCHRFCSWKCSKDANCCSKLTSAQISNISSRNTSETMIDFLVSFVTVTNKNVFASVIFQG